MGVTMFNFARTNNIHQCIVAEGNSSIVNVVLIIVIEIV